LVDYEEDFNEFKSTCFSFLFFTFILHNPYDWRGNVLIYILCLYYCHSVQSKFNILKRSCNSIKINWDFGRLMLNYVLYLFLGVGEGFGLRGLVLLTFFV